MKVGENISFADGNYWFVNLLYNLLGYSFVFIPGGLIIYIVHKTKYLEKRDNQACLTRVLRMLVKGEDSDLSDNVESKSSSPGSKSTSQETLNLLFCFFGLQGSYLTWGIIQEKIMTTNYVSSYTTEFGNFSDSQFLVFMNRVLAFLISAFYIALTSHPRHTAPLYKYSYASFSNIMSSWCQYEALKYVSFPSQVLAKASKIIPVMFMGKIVSSKTYQKYEYASAVLISVGMTFFMLGNNQNNSETVTTFTGIFILAGYMLFDSFTSNWQGKLFTQHKMSSVQMMCGINLFSCLFTSVSLIQQGGFGKSLLFVSTYPAFFYDVIILSICSACGQLFIFRTISSFGPVIFVIMTTVRQILAIIISCILYGHRLSEISIFGIIVVFMAIFSRIYFAQRHKAQLKKASRNENEV